MTSIVTGLQLLTNNDNDSNWSGTDGPDAYNNAVQGTNSESWLISKNSTETGTYSLAAGTDMTDGAGRGAFIFQMSTNLAPYLTDIKVEMESTSGNYRQYTISTAANKNIEGKFVPTALDLHNKGTETGTFDPTNVNTIRVIVNNSSSGNIRSVINTWIDVMYYDIGTFRFTGTSAGNTPFEDAAVLADNSTNAYGNIWLYNGIIYAQSDFEFGGFTSEGETVVVAETDNGYATLEIAAVSDYTLTNTSLLTSGAASYNLDLSGATTTSIMNGGVLKGYNTLTSPASGASKYFDGTIFQDGGTATFNCIADNCTFNACGITTVNNTLTNCTFNDATGTTAVITDNLAKLSDCKFNSDGSSHAVELSSLGSGSMTWTGITTAYDSGSTGSPVTPTSTGNETIYVNVASGTLTINVADGATIPSIRSAGATVNVVAGQKTFTFTVSPSITGYEWRIYTVTAVGSLDGAVEVSGEETATQDNQSLSHSYTSQAIAVQIIDSNYEESVTYYTLSNTSNQNVTITLTKDNNA